MHLNSSSQGVADNQAGILSTLLATECWINADQLITEAHL
jgi:hypothetical protein